MKASATLSRLLQGLIFFAAGVNGYLVLFGLPGFLPTSPPAIELLGDGWLLALLKTVELIAGLFLLINRYVPLGLTMLVPCVVSILLFHLFADPALLLNAVVVTLLQIHLLWVYRQRFEGILSP
ncbi:hypothetical protein OS242_21190 [Tumebacillus sp. DT12]|uniref:DoxX family protein n=1 Tax=Tumebacillus lacus TaxID=2995335 RepID=A0ABT3XCB0_9BACL|nr:hypothetical protein [Tumebacillus lacus]MCX7572404.1 hypothetical protein [Tumebacillus lacus]